MGLGIFDVNGIGRLVKERGAVAHCRSFFFLLLLLLFLLLLLITSMVTLVKINEES